MECSVTSVLSLSYLSFEGSDTISESNVINIVRAGVLVGPQWKSVFWTWQDHYTHELSATVVVYIVLHKINPINILAWGGRDSWVPTPNWEAMTYWWFLGEGERSFTKDVSPSRPTKLQWRSPIPRKGTNLGDHGKVRLDQEEFRRRNRKWIWSKHMLVWNSQRIKKKY